MSNLRNFIFWIVVTFGVPWLFLVVIPTFQMAGLKSESFKDAEDNTIFYPGTKVDSNGIHVYRAEGCANCHTQVIRPLYAGFDGQRKGWGSDQSERPELTRPSRAQDYLGENYAFIGVQRNGPDLSNVGFREMDEAWHHKHLFDPRSVNQWSNMPSFRHLYKKQEIQGSSPSDDAVYIDGEFEYVPTEKATSLVRYLLSLKKDSPAPNVKKARSASAGDEEAPAEAAAAEGTPAA